MFSSVTTIEPLHRKEASILAKETVVLIFIFLIAFIPRILSLDAFMMADEQLWIKRSVIFLKALVGLDFKETLITGHPGVITMWLGSGPIVFAKKILHYSQLKDLLFPAKLPFALATAAAITAACAILLRLYNRQVALIAGLLLASDPFFTAYSRIIHLDAILTCTMALSVLFCIYFLRNTEKKKYLIMSGVFGGLAMLAKVPGVFLIVFIATLFLLDLIWRETGAGAVSASLKKRATEYGIWLATAAMVVFLLWPAMWVDPLTYVKLLERGPGLVAHEHGQYFMGKPIEDPGFFFYPLVILFRTTPVIFLFAAAYLMGAIWNFLKNPQAYRKIDFGALALIVFIVSFTIFMSIPSKKMERYLLPVFPAIAIVAALGIHRFWQMIKSRATKRRGATAVYGLLAVGLMAQLWPSFTSFPYYSTFYNPLTGGARLAKKAILIGNGEGLDLVAAYLNQKKNAAELTVASEFSYLLEVFFKGKVKSTKIEIYKPGTLDSSDYLVVYISGLQKQNLRLPDEVLQYYSHHRPEHVIELGGLVYASIFNLKNPS